MTPDASRAIWMYWENLSGRSRPAYLDLCLDTIRRHAGDADVRVVDRETVFTWLPDLRPDVWEGLPGPMHRSDYARTRLVHDHGGLWLDFDVIAVSPLGELLDRLDEHEVVGWGGDLEGRFYNNLFAGRPGAALLAEWIRRQDAVVAATDDLTMLPWAALGMDIMWPLAKRSEYHDIPSRRIAPVPWYAWRQLLSRVASPPDVLAHRPVTVMLWNSVMSPSVGALPRERVLAGQTLLSRLLRIGLGASTPQMETDAWTRMHIISDLRFSKQGRRVEHHARRAIDRLHPGPDVAVGSAV